jgi:RNA polymerase sigma factor (sigma-70 family)
LPLLRAMFAKELRNLTDGQLLGRFLTEGDEAAFALLIRRHGAMVLGVCRRILGNIPDAEDAFQAVFVVLLRKAGALTSRSGIGGWLHLVARMTASKAKAAAGIRQAKERNAARPEVHHEESRNDWLPDLDEEIARLPEKYRQALVLCDLEGKTRHEAALQLRWPEGTVAGRLARARALLAERLLRRVHLDSRVLPEPLAKTTNAPLPLALFETTLESVTRLAAQTPTAQFVLAEPVRALAKGVIRSMFWNKMKIVATVLVAAVGLAGVGGKTVQILAEQLRAQTLEKTPNDQVSEPAQGVEPAGRPQEKEQRAPEARMREEALLKAAKESYEARVQLLHNFIIGSVDQVIPWSVRWLNAQLRLADTRNDKLTAYEQHLKRMKDIEHLIQQRVDQGTIERGAFSQFHYYRLEAEIWLDDAKRAK